MERTPTVTISMRGCMIAPGRNPLLNPRPRVLIVDDNDSGRRALSRILEHEGFDVVSAANGRQALEALRTSPAPQFVLTDLRLPDLDGLELAYHARRLEPPPWIALITGYAPEGDAQDHQRWGLDFVFTKPLDLASLVARMRLVLGITAAAI